MQFYTQVISDKHVRSVATIDKDTIFFMTFLDDMGGRRDFLILIMLEDIGGGGGWFWRTPIFIR